ncbi:hypothetical protein M408DRAFT_63388 [Serendipita vermifera MAFF 305830]|uniref:AAA+ ATPase domain-containing protein n=1 Tax=Serendipita vermifera MAFF 305830 TaxID=933852 RepID=A0A0C2XT98_SERVB|nr:hypothetical protein M408DRAFT_63388 [Serendipita vermifera MAFF 305830]
MATDDALAPILNKLFNNVVHGQTQLNKRTYPRFIESICIQPDPPSCISKLQGSSGGFAAVQGAMRFDLSVNFFNGMACKLFRYLSSPQLFAVGEGKLLKAVLFAIVEPPIFWNPFVDALAAGKLSEEGQFGFSWLLSNLISLLSIEEGEPFRKVASDPDKMQRLLASESQEVRNLAQKIKHNMEIFEKGGQPEDLEAGPGGRHDNDFVDFRQISIVPTADEIQSTQPAFIRPSVMFDDHETKDSRQAIYCDNQFRLLREDMLYEIRDEMTVDKKRKYQRNFSLDGLRLFDPHYEPAADKKRDVRWSIVLQSSSDLWQLKKEKLTNPDKRKKWLRDNRNVVRHQSMACLMVEQELVALTTIDRDEELLAKNPPQIVVRIEGASSIMRALLKLKAAEKVKLVQMNAAIFAYQPVLQALQESRAIPLSEELLFWSESSEPRRSSAMPNTIIESIRQQSGSNLQQILRTDKEIILDQSQSASLLMGLTQCVSLIQGPPGTGKSFIGALLAKALHDNANSKILVVCYTNHALDQFLEDLMDIGIPPSSIVRLGGKSTDRTQPLSLQHVQRNSPGAKLTRIDWNQIQAIKAGVQKYDSSLRQAAGRYQQSDPRYEDVIQFLEFDDVDGDYYDAFSPPASVDGQILVSKNGKPLKKTYLINQWVNGWDAGVLIHHNTVKDFPDVWSMKPPERRAKYTAWKEAILKDQVQTIREAAQKYEIYQRELDAKFEEKDGKVLASKRIIGCTTTAAAKYREHIKAASPSVLLVEEAGEILESHVLTALAPSVQQLILIGDHKQLRPKVNNYQLTVEKGEGYDLNRSLFERLVLKGYPHETLSQQHRMRPEISALVRHLTYPDLVDAAKTKGRADIRGLTSNLVFIHHSNPEDDLPEASHLDSPDETSAKSSKSNKFEVDMVLMILRYLGQQGYHTDQIVILTPYLGQLRALQDALKKDNDPILNDLDYGDLVRAGLVTAASAQVAKKPIRLATIDNYQGEESDVVIASLTRSNRERKIGFMASPERVNVLLSRARDGLIMIGDANTFLEAKGTKVWTQLFEFLKTAGNIYDGLPVRCEKHQGRTAILGCPDDFNQMSPDGGCTQPCGIMLKCGVHTCPFKCHQLVDHSKMQCEQLLFFSCPKGHRKPFECYKGPPEACVQCTEDARLAEKKQKAAFLAQQKREKEQRQHDQAMADLDAKMTEHNEALRNKQLAEDRKRALEQRQRDLEAALNSGPSIPPEMPPSNTGSNASATASQNTPAPATQPNPSQTPKASPPSTSTAGNRNKPSQIPPILSRAEVEWKRQKEVEGVKNQAIDELMEMGGLEAVKSELLKIKAKVEITSRQGASLKGERFSASMLGNPGTGKTTVARIYGRFLASMQVIEGTTFEETTGARLANDGVDAVRKMIENLVNAGGGTLFIDEAYQLTSGHNPGGGKVLDFLLAEIENQVGKIVFLFAGYDREMEKFFEHNPGLPSRVPYTFKFEDYSDEVLMDILEKMLTKKFSGRMRVDDTDGLRGLYGRIAIRRLGRGRGKPGFGNARALENLFAQIHGRQTQRIEKDRRNGLACDPLVMLPEDLIGPDPSTVMVESTAWKKLQGMIGLDSVKKSVASFFSMVKTNYERELLEKEPHQVSLNRVFLGSPGTGKTTIAKLYGRILAELGLISNGEVIIKNPADFVGSALGQSESQTKAILASTVGKVLVIDEAYMLYGGGGSVDIYKTAVVDTIVAEVQSVPGEDRCVLLLGYKEQMEEMFQQNVNPGLARRFAIENAFYFHDYTDDELLKALEWKLKDQDLTATDEAKRVAIDVLGRARNRPNFGNIGEVENMLSRAKILYQERTTSPDAPFEPQDFDPDYRRNENAAQNLSELFKDVVGSDAVVEKLGKFQRMAQTCVAQGMEPREMIPTNFIFKGPPGTGKTTTARKMGQVFYDMGFISSTEVVECSTSDLVGQYVGQTGPKTKKLLEKARGRVLFIDEAYRLGDGLFAKEAVDELVSTLTLEQYRGRIIVILAGYDQEINNMLAVNPGLSSRFTEEIIFTNMGPAHCIQLLAMELAKSRIAAAFLKDPNSPHYRELEGLLESLSHLPSWGNARDLKELARRMVVTVFTTQTAASNSGGSLQLSGHEANACVAEMLSQRSERARKFTNKDPFHDIFQQALQGPQQSGPPPRTEVNHNIRTESPPPEAKEENRDGRDPGVSDAVWEQLQMDRKAEELAKQKAEEERKSLEGAINAALKKEQEDVETLRKMLAAEKAARDEEERLELMRQREQMRLREIALREERERNERLLAARRKEEAKRRAEEAKVQAKIRQMGLCVAGFQWIKQSNGYRCAGGVHFLDNATLGI